MNHRRNDFVTARGAARSRSAGICLLLLVAALDCSGRAEERAAVSTSGRPPATPPPSATPSTAPLASAGPLVRRPFHPYDNQFPDTSDRGTGVITLAIGPDSGRSFPFEDTLRFRAAPRPDAPVVAALIRERSEERGWSYAALAPADVTLNFLEHDYEESGVPTDSIDASGRWVRAIVAFTPAKVPLFGWASLDTRWVQTFSWEERIAERAWYFVDSASTVLYPTLAAAQAGRGGRPLPAHRFEIRVLERRPPWLRISMRWPVDVCAEPNASAKSGEFWVRYLDQRGRPLMFYPSRGC